MTDNPLIEIYVNKIENRITFKIWKFYLEFLMSETIDLLGSTEKKIHKNVENASHSQLLK